MTIKIADGELNTAVPVQRLIKSLNVEPRARFFSGYEAGEASETAYTATRLYGPSAHGGSTPTAYCHFYYNRNGVAEQRASKVSGRYRFAFQHNDPIYMRLRPFPELLLVAFNVFGIRSYAPWNNVARNV